MPQGGWLYSFPILIVPGIVCVCKNEDKFDSTLKICYHI